jgi:uncharacterized protein (DUF4213/DUF364 family)
MSEVLRRIIDSIEGDARVASVGVFRRAAAVVSRHAGVAYGFWEGGRAPISWDRLRRLEGGSARELSELAFSHDPVEASIGVAAINSLVEPSGRRIERNGYEIALERAAGRRLAVVGHFRFVKGIGDRVDKLWVLELRPQEGDLPAERAPEIIPLADVVVITGTTLVNHTADDLLGLARGKTVIMLGPTTIMSPVLFEFGVSAICGVQILDPAVAIGHLKEGRSMRDLEGIRRICLVP